jgi:hypothetical protein
MSGYKTVQHHLSHRGRSFHFVSYEGQPANPRTGASATPATWCLMCAGKRWPAIEQGSDEEEGAITAALTDWLDHHVFNGAHPA